MSHLLSKESGNTSTAYTYVPHHIAYMYMADGGYKVWIRIVSNYDDLKGLMIGPLLSDTTMFGI